jgi:radical SAM superfamily enzyme YgiQ (UPF0313 family)
MDILFISPGNSSGVYQDLAETYSAIEPPTWALLLAQSCRSVGLSVSILDANAEKLSNDQILERVESISPNLICFVVYGQNVNSGTVNMTGAVLISSFLKEKGLKIPISYAGSYVQAVPFKAMQDEPSIDFAFTNEGVYALRNVAKLKDFSNLDGIKGIVWRKDGKITINPPEQIVPNDKMDTDLPGYAWDLLPFKEKPLDLYRAPLWHSEYDTSKRTPYAAIQTSLGCQFACSFCMINMINRNDNEEIGVAGRYSGMRYWSPEFIVKEFDKLHSYGVKTIKITDEMFLLNKKFYAPLCEMLGQRSYSKELRMWAYSRIDTVRNPELLKLVRSAGIKWLALGIESADKEVRLEVSKGKFEDVDIRRVISQVNEAGIEVIANYIFGLPGDTLQSMRKTLDFSKELLTLGWNAFPAMALPGSQLYKDAISKGVKMPDEYGEYAFHGYASRPLPTETLSSSDILKFRDLAFEEYHSNPEFLEKVKTKFGITAERNIKEMLAIKVKRQRVEEQNNK